MSAAPLRLIYTTTPKTISIPFAERLADHQAILESYFDTHITRGHSDVTLESARFRLTSWFQRFLVPDPDHPAGERQLFIWEAMAPVLGRERIVAYGKCLFAAELARSTIRGHLTSLRRLFDYVMQVPYIPGTTDQRIDSKYGPIEQPVLEYDYPKHVLDSEWGGNFLSEERLDGFYAFIRDHYVQRNQKVLVAWRDYTMIVMAAESGLRGQEICKLDGLGPNRDLFYGRGRVRTRFGKGFRGSGPRVRETILTPFVQQTVQAYEQQIRPHFRNAETNPALFLAETGTRMTYNAAWQALKGIVRAARQHGLDLPANLSWHDFRRSFATNFAERQPADVCVLMELMGHRTATTIHRYVRPSQRYVDAVLEDYVRALTDHIREE